jgi:hypothetical protein
MDAGTSIAGSGMRVAVTSTYSVTGGGVGEDAGEGEVA